MTKCSGTEASLRVHQQESYFRNPFVVTIVIILHASFEPDNDVVFRDITSRLKIALFAEISNSIFFAIVDQIDLFDLSITVRSPCLNGSIGLLFEVVCLGIFGF